MAQTSLVPLIFRLQFGGGPYMDGCGTETRLRNTGLYSDYDLAPDGKRLAALVADNANEEKPPTHLTFLLNFFDELRRKVLVGK